MKNGLIINADDYARDENVSNAILDSFKGRMVSDTSIMVTTPYFDKALSPEKQRIFGREAGLHFCITLGTPLTEEMRKDTLFCDSDGNFKKQLSEDFPKYYLSSKERIILENEIIAQYNKLANCGIKITHFDSHQHVHWRSSILSSAIKCCKKLNIKTIRYPHASAHDSWKQRFLNGLERFFITLNGLHIVNQFGAADYYKNIKGLHVNSSEVMCHPMYNSKGEIANKVRVRPVDECGLLKDDLNYDFPFVLIKFSDL